MSAKGRIRKARLEDVECIHLWLREQNEANIDGTFLCNWNLTLDSFKSKQLIVFVESSTEKAIAYQWGALTSPGILEVRADMRGKGVGKRLVEYRVKQARKKGLCVLWIQCKPASSIPFWQKMGFELLEGGCNYAYKLLRHQLAMPKDGKEVSVIVRLYPNARQWNEGTPPSLEIYQTGLIVNDNIVYLPERICIPEL
jgi:GNAT superfamily N-acetyltransferase